VREIKWLSILAICVFILGSFFTFLNINRFIYKSWIKDKEMQLRLIETANIISGQHQILMQATKESDFKIQMLVGELRRD